MEQELETIIIKMKSLSIQYYCQNGSSVLDLNRQFDNCLTQLSNIQLPNDYQLLIVNQVPRLLSTVIIGQLKLYQPSVYLIIDERYYTSDEFNIFSDPLNGNIYIRLQTYPELFRQIQSSQNWSELVKFYHPSNNTPSLLEFQWWCDEIAVPLHLSQFHSQRTRSPIYFGESTINQELNGLYLSLLDLGEFGQLERLLSDFSHTSILVQNRNNQLQIASYLCENTISNLKDTFIYQFYTRLIDLYGFSTLVDFIDLVCQVIYPLIYYKIKLIVEGYQRGLEQTHYQIFLPDRNHSAIISFAQLSSVVKQQMINNDGQFDTEDIRTYQVYWRTMLQKTHQFASSDYQRLRQQGQNEIQHILTFLTSQIQIGNNFDDGQLIDPINLEPVDRTKPENIYYDLTDSGTFYLFTKSTLREYIHKTLDLTNPCTRIPFTVQNLLNIGFTREEIVQLEQRTTNLKNTRGQKNTQGQNQKL